DVDWSIQGNTNLVDTFIEDGLLAVALNEGANTLTVTARSAFDPGRYATATVTLTNPEPGQVTITVTIDPQTTSVVAGGSVPFTVTVNVTGQPADVLAVSSAVTWDVAGNEIPSTAVGSLSPDTYSATLFVAGNETAETLTVTATSAHDPTRSASATVTVSEAEPVTAVWLVGLADTWTMPGTPMTPGDDGIFTWEGDVVAPANTFRFNLTDTANWAAASWFAPEANNTPAVLGINQMIRFTTNPDTAWTLQDGWYRLTVDTVAATLYVERPVVITGVTVSGPSNIQAGDSTAAGDFHATVQGTNPGQGVTWSIVGARHADTTIDAGTGVLRVSINEDAASLTIRATSSLNTEQYGQRSIYVDPPDEGIHVEISPRETSAARGDEVGFTATVTVVPAGADIPTTVTWTVGGNTSNGTEMVYTAGAHTATLFVASDENAETLTVTVRSTHDTTRYDTATVSLLGVPNVWLVGHMAGTGWNHPGEPMTRQASGIFIWEGYVEERADGSFFRFNLSAATTSWNNGSWFAPEANSTAIVLGSNAMMRFDNPANPYRAWTIAPGWYRFTLDSVAATLNVERPAIVDSVTITNPPTEIFQGGFHDFNAVLAGRNLEDVTVTWTVTAGGVAGTGFGTDATANRLTIAPGQAIGSSLTITASAGGQTDTVNVQVADPATFGGVEIALEIADRGSGLAIVGGIPTTPVVISRTGSNGNPTFVTFAATPGAGTIRWIVSGVSHDDVNSITINANDQPLGRHTVRLVVTIDGVPWSLPQILHFTVER
ncbi:MAG: hypothetical protein FWD88_07725, partial [Treponema sp.]|nr:hypothetical protein [Treponema sp.]